MPALVGWPKSNREANCKRWASDYCGPLFVQGMHVLYYYFEGRSFNELALENPDKYLGEWRNLRGREGKATVRDLVNLVCQETVQYPEAKDTEGVLWDDDDEDGQKKSDSGEFDDDDDEGDPSFKPASSAMVSASEFAPRSS